MKEAIEVPVIVQMPLEIEHRRILKVEVIEAMLEVETGKQ